MLNSSCYLFLSECGGLKESPKYLTEWNAAHLTQNKHRGCVVWGFTYVSDLLKIHIKYNFYFNIVQVTLCVKVPLINSL